ALPFREVARAHRRATEAVQDLSLQTETRKLSLVPTPGDRLLLRHDFPRLAGKVPPAAERVQKCRNRMPHSRRLARDQEQVLAVVLENEPFGPQLIEALELPPGKVRGEPDVNAGHPFPGLLDSRLRTANRVQVLAKLIDGLLDTPGENGQLRDTVLRQNDGS